MFSMRKVAVLSGTALLATSLLASPITAQAATADPSGTYSANDDVFTFYTLNNPYRSGTVYDDSAYKAASTVGYPFCVADNDSIGIPQSEWGTDVPHVTFVTQPTYGAIVGAGDRGCFNYIPSATLAKDSFVYQITDVDGATHQATVTIFNDPIQNLQVTPRDWGVTLSNPNAFLVDFTLYDPSPAATLRHFNYKLLQGETVTYVITGKKQDQVGLDAVLAYQITGTEIPEAFSNGAPAPGVAVQSVFPVYSTAYPRPASFVPGAPATTNPPVTAKTVKVTLNNKASKVKKHYRLVSTSAKTGKVEYKIKTVKKKTKLDYSLKSRKINTTVKIQVKKHGKWVTAKKKLVK